jgi:hypothetical protein
LISYAICLINHFIFFLLYFNNQPETDDKPLAAGADVQHDSPQPVSARLFVSKNLMVRRSVRRKVSSDKAVPTASPNKQAMASDDQGHSGLPQLESSLAGVIASLFGDNHSVVSNALRAYDRLVLKESHNIYVNQEKILEAQRQIKKSQLNIKRVQKSLVDDIRTILKSSNTDEVRSGTSPRDICAAKRRVEVSRAIFYFSHSIFVSAILFSVNYFVCQAFLYVSHFSYASYFLYVNHFILYDGHLI